MDGCARIAIAFATAYANTPPASNSSQTIAWLLVPADQRRRGAGAARRNRAIGAHGALSAQSAQPAQRLRTEYPATAAGENSEGLACEAQYWNLWLSGRQVP